jgi:hypothetical protein
MRYVHMVGGHVWHCEVGYGLPLDPSVHDHQDNWTYMGDHEGPEVLPALLGVPSAEICIYDCQEEMFIDFDEFTGARIYDGHDVVCYVSVYAEERRYGGPEEGGWWYNTMEHVLSLPLIDPGDRDEVELLTDVLRPRFTDEGDIYSVNGGTRYHVTPEARQGSRENTRRPRYE